MQTVRIILLLICVSVLPGCGGERYDIVPVSGVITLDGEPLPGARIGFEPRAPGDSPNAGPGSYGLTDNQGRFTLEALTGESGAVVTTHDVWIRTHVAPANRSGEVIEPVDEKVPARYNDQSELTFEVPEAGTDRADFNLTTDP